MNKKMFVKILIVSMLTIQTFSMVIRDNFRVKRDNVKNVCEEKRQVISPVVVQNTKGQMRFIVQDSGDDLEQTVEIVTCMEPGSSCAGCQDQEDVEVKMVCSNTYQEVRLRSRDAQVKSEVMWDSFMFPSGCDCYTLE